MQLHRPALGQVGHPFPSGSTGSICPIVPYIQRHRQSQVQEAELAAYFAEGCE